MPVLLSDLPAVFLLGCMGHWNRDRNCKPAQLTGCLLGVVSPVVGAPEHRTPPRLSTPWRGGVLNMRNNSAAPKWSKLWRDLPQPCDHFGAYTTEQLERMDQEFTAAVERAFRAGDESEMAATATYDLRRR
jgi:hypothetical protein